MSSAQCWGGITSEIPTDSNPASTLPASDGIRSTPLEDIVTWAPSTYLRSILVTAVAVGFPQLRDDETVGEEIRNIQVNSSVHEIRRYLEWREGWTVRGGLAADFHRQLEDYIKLLGEHCSLSWDGDNYNWEHYTDRLQHWLEDHLGRSL